MKVTSYSISKTLAEIGFKKESNLYWQNYDCKGKNGLGLFNRVEFFLGGNMQIEAYGDVNPQAFQFEPENIVFGEKYNAYDLETILDVLPDEIKLDCHLEQLTLSKTDIGYVSWALPNNMRIRIKAEENESLADTAARLLILLVEKEIITFKS